MKTFFLLAILVSAISFSACKKCTTCHGISTTHTTFTGAPVEKELNYCGKNNIELDTVYVDGNGGVDGVPAPTKDPYYIQYCR